MQPKKIALLTRELMCDKKAEDPVILDISKQSSIAHYFVIAHGNSEPHVRAIANHVVEGMKKLKRRIWQVEGFASAEWIVIDLGSVLVHVFYRGLRSYYSLERLWGDSKKLD